MKRRRDADGPRCELCRKDRPGQVYHYYAGQHLETQRRRAFLSSTTHVRSTYQGIHRYAAFVCDACCEGLARRRYGPGAAGWSLAALACGGGAAYVFATGTGRDQMWAILGI